MSLATFHILYHLIKGRTVSPLVGLNLLTWCGLFPVIGCRTFRRRYSSCFATYDVKVAFIFYLWTMFTNLHGYRLQAIYRRAIKIYYKTTMTNRYISKHTYSQTQIRTYLKKCTLLLNNAFTLKQTLISLKYQLLSETAQRILYRCLQSPRPV